MGVHFRKITRDEPNARDRLPQRDSPVTSASALSCENRTILNALILQESLAGESRHAP